MTIIIIIFFIAIIGAFGMLLFRAWEIRTYKVDIANLEDKNNLPKLSFRYIEKIILYLTKHVIQWIILFSVKLWYTVIAKSKGLIQNKLPKINTFFKKKVSTDSRKISFVERAVIESKIKIKRVKEKIKKEHESKLEAPTESEVSEKIDEVDKIL